MRHDRNVSEEGDGPGADVVKRLGQLFGLAVGIVALVYVAGGGAFAIRLYLRDLPSLGVTSQLPRDYLISIGLAQIVSPALGVAAIYGIVRLLWGNAPPPTRFVDEWEPKPSWRGWRALFAASAIPAAVATGFAAHQMVSFTGDWRKLLPSLVVTFLVTLLITLVALNLRARLALRARRKPATHEVVRERWNEGSAVVRMALVMALATTPFGVVFAGTLPMLDARVCITAGRHVQQVDGVLVGETSTRTFIGETGTKRPKHVFSIPEAEIIETIIGGNVERKTCIKAIQ